MVFDAMKRTMEESMKLIHARYVVDLFRKLHKHRIGTTRIHGLARKMCDYLPQQKAIVLIDTVVRWKPQDAERCLKKARYDNTQSWRREKQLMEQEDATEAAEAALAEARKELEAERAARKELEAKLRALQGGEAASLEGQLDKLSVDGGDGDGSGGSSRGSILRVEESSA